MKPVDVKSSTVIDSGLENNDKDPKFKVGGHVTIKMKNFFAKVLVILILKKFLECFMKKNSKNQIKQNLELKK